MQFKKNESCVQLKKPDEHKFYQVKCKTVSQAKNILRHKNLKKKKEYPMPGSLQGQKIISVWNKSSENIRLQEKK